MKKAIQSILTGLDGTMSTKRVVLFLVVFLFIAVIIVNLYDKSKVLDKTYSDQLFIFLQTNVALVFGEGAIGAFKGLTGKAGITDDTKPA